MAMITICSFSQVEHTEEVLVALDQYYSIRPHAPLIQSFSNGAITEIVTSRATSENDLGFIKGFIMGFLARGEK